MDYRDTVFLKAAENLSFSKAAKELFISQPAVTNHIKELENRLNTTLFHRKGSRIYLTKSGEMVYGYFKKINDLYREVEFKIGALNDTFKGELRIGASSTILQYLLPKAIAAFHKLYPNIQLFLYNGNSYEMEQKLLEGEVDAALVENEVSHPNIKYVNFFEDEIVVITGASSVYSKRKLISVADLYEIPIVLREKGSGTLEVIQNAFKNQNINFDKLNIFIHLGSTEAIKNFLCDFDGIALVSEKSIEKEILLKEIVKVELKNITIKRQLRIALRQGHVASLTKIFVDFLTYYNF